MRNVILRAVALVVVVAVCFGVCYGITCICEAKVDHEALFDQGREIASKMMRNEKDFQFSLISKESHWGVLHGNVYNHGENFILAYDNCIEGRLLLSSAFALFGVLCFLSFITIKKRKQS